MPSIQIFSPHIDDAVFSLGGSMLNWQEKGINVKVHNIFTVSNWITPNSISGIKDPMSVAEITAMRRREEDVVSRELNFEFDLWGYLEVPLRAAFTEADDAQMKAEIFDRISKCLNTDDLFFFPIGVEHVDHLIVRSIAKHFETKGYKIFYYEDLPYVSWGRFDYQEVFNRHLVDEIPVIEKIDYNRKADALRHYPSQVCEDFINSIRAYCYSPVDNHYYERYWRRKIEIL